MTRGLIGRKIGMTQVYSETGDVIPVTVLQVGPCNVSQIKTIEKDGYAAIQVAFEEVKSTKLSKAELAHLEKGKNSPMRYLKEFKSEGGVPEVGAVIKAADVFRVHWRHGRGAFPPCSVARFAVLTSLILRVIPIPVVVLICQRRYPALRRR